MKRILILIVLLILSLSLIGKETIENEDKPMNGKWDFNLNKVWEVDYAGNDMLVQAGSIIIGDDGNVYTLDRKHGKIFVFNADGKFLNSIGKKGEGPGEYKMAFRIYLHKDTIIVPDMGRFHYFNKSGKYLETINTGVSIIFPKLMINEYRFIYEKGEDDKDKKIDQLNVFNIKTKKITNITEIVSTKPQTASSGGMTLVLKMDSTSVAFNRGELYFGKGDKYFINKIDIKGNKILSFSIKGRKKIKVTEIIKRKKYEGIILNGGKMPKNMVDQLIKNEPNFAPYFNKLNVYNGYVFVYLEDPGNENSQKIDMFSKDGKYIYSSDLILPDEMILKSGPVFKDGFAYVFAEDEEGEGKLIKFKTSLPK